MADQQLEQLIAIVGQLQLQVQAIQEDRATALGPAPAAPPPAPAANDYPIEKPPTFDGKRSEVTNFLTQLFVYFEAQRDRFPNDTARCLAASQFLRGAAYSWIQPSLTQRPLPPRLTDLQVFMTDLRTTFGDPHELSNAALQIINLRQTSSVATYSTEFSRLASLLAWPDPPLIPIYYQGLKDEVKDELVRVDRPEILQDFITLTLRIDQRLQERRLERQRSPIVRPPLIRPTQATTVPPRPLPPTARPGSGVPAITDTPLLHPNGTPMELGANRPSFRRLTPEERNYRISNRLCLYCGVSGHMAIECPQRPSRALRTAVAELPPIRPTEPAVEPPLPTQGNVNPQA